MQANRLAFFRLFSASTIALNLLLVFIKIIKKYRYAFIIAILLIVSGFKMWGANDVSQVDSMPVNSLKVNQDSNTTHILAKIVADSRTNNSLTAAENETQLPLTALELHLVGILIKNNDKDFARAIISVDGTQKSYPTNAQLPAIGKVFLRKITRDYVVLNNNGRDELLRLYDGELLVSGDAMISLDASKEVPIFYGRTPGLDEPPPYIPDQKAEEATLSEINHDFGGLMSMTIQRNDSNNQLIGYKINPAPDASKFIAAGLQKGDMITAINGIPVTKAEQILEAYENLESETVALEIERDGSVVNLEVKRIF